jgi:hypothetical protein
MKREGYKFGVAWIAENDGPGDNDNAETIAGYISVLLLADLFHKEAAAVAQDVVRYRHARSS